MTRLKGVSRTLLAMLALSAMLGACQRQTEPGQAGTTPQTPPIDQQSSASAPSAGSESAGATDSSAGAAGTGTSAGRAVDDSIITTKAKTALLADTAIKGTDVHIETDKGVVILTGAVDSREQINRAESIVKTIDGVKMVDNRLTLKQ